MSAITGPLPVADLRRSRAAPPVFPGGEGAVRGLGEVPHDPEAWTADTAVTALYSMYWQPLVRLATLLTRDFSVAEEIVQDAFVALHRRWHHLTDVGLAHAYLRTSVVNGSRSALRHRQVVERLRQPGPSEPPGPEERVLQALQDDRVFDALHALPRRQREVLILRYYADLSEAEIAAALGVSAGAVKTHAHRGMAAMRTALSGDLEVRL